MPELKSVNRITNLPIVEIGWNYSLHIYMRIKESSSLINITLNQAEDTIFSAVETAMPAINIFGGTLESFDNFICKSLDIVEQRVPSICLPPQTVYFNTKQYVTDVSTKLAQPVLKRADSMKQLGNSVLSNKYTVLAADTLDGALNIADKYVDKYLPDDAPDQVPDENSTEDGSSGKAIQTIHHVDRFSRKLQRRLTRRTLAEARALKEQSTECIHVLIYVAELIATDPKLAFQKGKELWASLSKDEPENQARPHTLEQLIVMLTRESARRVVHLINFTSGKLGQIPTQISHTTRNATHRCLVLIDSLVKAVHLETVKNAAFDGAAERIKNLQTILKTLNSYTTDLLEHLVNILSGKGHNVKAIAVPSHAALQVPQQKPIPKAANRPKHNASNGVDSQSTT